MDFNLIEEDETPQKERAPKKRFRKNKLKLVFDVDERKNFLLGFRKRKQERKEKYIEKLERDLVKEKKRIRQQTQRATKKLSNSHAVLPEVQSIIDSMPEKEETYDLGNTLVSITSLDDQIYRDAPLKKEETDSEQEDTRSKNRLNKTKIFKTEFKNDSDESEDDDNQLKDSKNDPFFNSINDDELSGSDVSSEDEKNIPYNPMEMLRKSTESSSADAPDQNGMTKAKLERDANRMLQQSNAFKKMQKVKQKRSKKFRMFRLQPKEEGGDGSSKGAAASKNLKGGGGKRGGSKSKPHKKGRGKGK